MEKKELNLTGANVLVTTQLQYESHVTGGEWFYLIYYKDRNEFDAACRKIYSNEKEPVFIYLDFEHIIPAYISLKWISPEIFPLIRCTAELPVEEQTTFSAWLDYFRPDLGEIQAENLMESYRNSQQGAFCDEESFASYYAKEYLNITPENTPGFDLKGYARQLFSGHFLFINGHVYTKV